MLIAGGRAGRVGIRLALVGAAFLCLFGVQLAVSLIRTGDIPDNFILFLLGFLLILVGQLLFARDLRPAVGRAWVFPIVGVLGLVMALFLEQVGLHDIGLFVFEGAWIGLGVALLRGGPASGRACGERAGRDQLKANSGGRMTTTAAAHRAKTGR